MAAHSGELRQDRRGDPESGLRGEDHMIVRIGLLRKKPDWSVEAFRRHWLERHGPLAAKLPGLRRYEQNHVIDRAQRGIPLPRGQEQLDGFSELCFEDAASMRAGADTDAGRTLTADEHHFIDDLRVVVVERTEVIAPRLDRGLAKAMWLLRRRAECSPDAFTHQWREVHAGLIGKIDGLRGCRHNLVRARQAPKGRAVGYDGLPIDGIAELWFDDPRALDDAFATAAGQAVAEHAGTFLAEITTFLVERHVIV
jgi:uncharacterized protein (TIGR02118 family)